MEKEDGGWLFSQVHKKGGETMDTDKIVIAYKDKKICNESG